MPSGLTKENLEEAIAECHSLRQIAVYLGYAVSGGNTRNIKKKIKEYGLSAKTGGNHKGRRMTLEEILVENSPYQDSKYLKLRLVREGLLINECVLCKTGPVWNGLPLTLQLDHINGSHSDNRIENLRILCPNCHTQTETWGMKVRAPVV